MLAMYDEKEILLDYIECERYEANRQGEIKKLITQVCRKLRKSKSPQTIAEELEEYEPILQMCQAAEKCAPEYDVDEIYRLYTDQDEVC